MDTDDQQQMRILKSARGGLRWNSCQHARNPSSIFHLPSPALRAFTLIEIVLVLTLLTIIVGAIVPSIRGIKDEHMAREPVTALARMAKEARLHAMKEKRPYQIAFTTRGFTATRYLSPYLQTAQLEEFVLKAESGVIEVVEQQESPQESSNFADAAARPVQPAYQEWTQRYELPQNMAYGVQVWHESEKELLAGEAVKLWVFQPSGVVQPITVRLERESAVFEVTFSALTADIVKEKAELR